MKSILILRHAKSSWKDPDVNDHDRPLNKRGKRDAPHMGELLQDKHLVPDNNWKAFSPSAETNIGSRAVLGDVSSPPGVTTTLKNSPW